MSTHTSSQKITTSKIQAMKGRGSIVSLTAYTKPMAELNRSRHILLVFEF